MQNDYSNIENGYTKTKIYSTNKIRNMHK